MVDTRVHILYCNLTPPENFRLSYSVNSFWCPSPLTVSDGIGPDDEKEKEVKYIQLPFLPLEKYQEQLKNNSEQIPVITIKVFYIPISKTKQEQLSVIDVGQASIRMYADIVYQNRPTWKWLSIRNQWGDKICGKIFVQLSAKINTATTPSPSKQQLAIPETETDREEDSKVNLIERISRILTEESPTATLVLGSPGRGHTVEVDTNGVLSTPPNRDRDFTANRSNDRRRPSSFVKPIHLTPFPRDEQAKAKGARNSSESNKDAADLVVTILPSAMTHHDDHDKILRPKKTVSFRIKSLPRRTKSRHSLLNLEDASHDREHKGINLSKIPVPINPALSSTNTNTKNKKIDGSPKLNTTLPI